ncbi:MAG: replication-associated recombination protein A, partial [Saprospiraceae bacterium]|nr:replication-associated recombination protein A [Saprospiraceae bacterium]
LDYGKDYKYAHGFEGNFVQSDFLPDELTGKIIYTPGKNTSEQKILEQLINNWKGLYDYNK